MMHRMPHDYKEPGVFFRNTECLQLNFILKLLGDP